MSDNPQILEDLKAIYEQEQYYRGGTPTDKPTEKPTHPDIVIRSITYTVDSEPTPLTSRTNTRSSVSTFKPSHGRHASELTLPRTSQFLGDNLFQHGTYKSEQRLRSVLESERYEKEETEGSEDKKTEEIVLDYCLLGEQFIKELTARKKLLPSRTNESLKRKEQFERTKKQLKQLKQIDFKKISHIIETREFRETKRNLSRQVKQQRADEAADKARILKNDIQIQKLLQGRKYKMI